MKAANNDIVNLRIRLRAGLNNPLVRKAFTDNPQSTPAVLLALRNSINIQSELFNRELIKAWIVSPGDRIPQLSSDGLTVTYFTPGSIEEWQTLLDKITGWNGVDIDNYYIYRANNVFDLLYDTEGNGNNDSVGFLLFGKAIRLYNSGNWVEDLESYSPPYLFSTKLHADINKVNPKSPEPKQLTSVDVIRELVSAAPEPQIHSSVKPAGVSVPSLNRGPIIEDRPLGIVYDYDLVKNVYFGIADDYEFRRIYQLATGETPDIYRIYPWKYSELLGRNPVMWDRDALRTILRRNIGELMTWLDGASLEHIQLYGLRPVIAVLNLTDREIELLLDLHFRVLDPDDPVKINTVLSARNLIQPDP